MHTSAHVYSRGAYERSDKKFPEAVHPIVRTHPVTGRKCLFVNRGFTKRIEGLKKHESDALLEMLLRHAETPEFQCRFRWDRNSVAFWDNRCAHAPRDVRLSPACAARPSRHHQGRPAILTGKMP